MSRQNGWLSVAAAVVVSAALAVPAHADSASCQKTIVKTLLKYKKTYLGVYLKCLRAENVGNLPGPCTNLADDPAGKIQATNLKVVAKIAASCTSADLAALNYRTDCQYETATAGKEGVCAAKTVTVGTDIDPTKFAECLKCWKGAELSEYVAILFASHAVELCGSLDESSATCSDLNCTSPLPDQRNLGDTDENRCQVSIGKAGIKYLLKREQILEKCALGGGTRASCLGDPTVQGLLSTAEQKKRAAIKGGRTPCGNRDPNPHPPFCCKTGTGNQCTAASTRQECTDPAGINGQVQEGKVCGTSGTCDPVPGSPKLITWWGSCPESDTCPGTALSTLDDLIGCVDTSADAIVDELLCLQFRGNGGADWPCPAGD